MTSNAICVSTFPPRRTTSERATCPAWIGQVQLTWGKKCCSEFVLNLSGTPDMLPDWFVPGQAGTEPVREPGFLKDRFKPDRLDFSLQRSLAIAGGLWSTHTPLSPR